MIEPLILLCRRREIWGEWTLTEQPPPDRDIIILRRIYSPQTLQVSRLALAEEWFEVRKTRFGWRVDGRFCLTERRRDRRIERERFGGVEGSAA